MSIDKRAFDEAWKNHEGITDYQAAKRLMEAYESAKASEQPVSEEVASLRETLQRFFVELQKERGFSGICSAHQTGEDKSCQTCYPNHQPVGITGEYEAFLGDNVELVARAIAGAIWQHSGYAGQKSKKTYMEDYWQRYVFHAQDAIAAMPKRESGTPLFKQGTFTSHSGLQLSDKIDCDALTDEDWAALAKWFSDRIGFGKVVGVPTGGLKFAEALEPYASPFGPVLIVDDVLTTGKSMEEARLQYPDAVGAVLFSRTANIPKWITARFIESNVIEDGATK